MDVAETESCAEAPAYVVRGAGGVVIVIFPEPPRTVPVPPEVAVERAAPPLATTQFGGVLPQL